MMSFRVKVTAMRPATMMVRAWNHLIAGAYRLAGEYWVEHFLPLHFTAGAVQRYSYAARTRRYLERKRFAKALRDGKGNWFVPIKPPLPLVYSDQLRKDVLGRNKSAFNIRATATSNKHQVRVPVRIPHPLNPKNAGEIVRWNDQEKEILRGVIMQAMKLSLAWQEQLSETKEFGSAA